MNNMQQEITLQQLKDEGYFVAYTVEQGDNDLRIYYLQEERYEVETLPDVYTEISTTTLVMFTNEEVIFYE